MKTRSGKRTARETQVALVQYTAWNISFINITLSSLQATTAVIHSLTIRLRVWCATWEVVQQSSWFQHEHSVRTAGPWSMVDIWSQKTCTLIENEAATFAGTRYRKLQLVHKIKTNQLSTLLKSSVEHYHVRCTMMAGNWPASFALNDEYVDKELKYTCLCGRRLRMWNTWL